MEPPESVKNSTDLDITILSCIDNPVSSSEGNQSRDESTNRKELQAFEFLENAAANHDSFTSNVSYLERYMIRSTSRKVQPVLIPPSYFENTSDDTILDVSEIPDQSTSQSSPRTEVEDLDSSSDADTHSVASVSAFHASLPIVASTPADSTKKKAVSRRSTLSAPEMNSKDHQQEPLNIVRALFPSSKSPGKKFGRQRSDVEDRENITPVNVIKEAEVHSSAQSTMSISLGEHSVLVGDLKSKLKELTAETARLKTENTRTTGLRLEFEAAKKQLEKDRKTFEAERARKMKELEDIAKAESDKLEMERRLLQKHINLQKEQNDKLVKELTEDLKTQVKTIQEELKRAETREKQNERRFKDKIQTLEVENSKLRDRVDELEEEKQQLVREVARLSKKMPVSLLPNSSRPGTTAKEQLNDLSSPRSAAPPQPETERPLDPTSSGSPAVSQPAVPPLPSNGCKPILKGTNSAAASPRSVQFEIDASFASSNAADEVSEESKDGNGTIEITYKDGRKVRRYKNGTKKETSRDGKCSITHFHNGDVHQVLPDKEVYFYHENQTLHTKYPDGTEEFKFANNQVERLYPDGRKEVQYPKGLVRIIHPSGNEECSYPDGNKVFWNDKNRTRTIYFANGETEIHTPDWKRREVPGQAVKTVFTDGRSETVYQNGRTRIKDARGNVVYDGPKGQAPEMRIDA